MKTLLSIVVLCLPLLATAQFASGDKYLGGAFTFQRQHDTSKIGPYNTYSNYLSIAPQFGYFLKSNLAVGGSLGYFRNKQEEDPGTPAAYGNTNQGIVVNTFVRRYYSISEKFLFTLDGHVDFIRGFATALPANYGTQSNYSLTLGVTPGIVLFPAPQWGFQLSVGGLSYVHSQWLSNDLKGNALTFQLGVYQLGLSYYFRNSKS